MCHVNYSHLTLKRFPPSELTHLFPLDSSFSYIGRVHVKFKGYLVEFMMSSWPWSTNGINNCDEVYKLHKLTETRERKTTSKNYKKTRLKISFDVQTPFLCVLEHLHITLHLPPPPLWQREASFASVSFQTVVFIRNSCSKRSKLFQKKKKKELALFEKGGKD